MCEACVQYPTWKEKGKEEGKRKEREKGEGKGRKGRELQGQGCGSMVEHVLNTREALHMTPDSVPWKPRSYPAAKATAASTSTELLRGQGRRGKNKAHNEQAISSSRPIQTHRHPLPAPHLEGQGFFRMSVCLSVYLHPVSPNRKIKELGGVTQQYSEPPGSVSKTTSKGSEKGITLIFWKIHE